MKAEEERPIVALMYDFDKTLCTKDMQEYGFIPALGMSPAEFWEESNVLCKRTGMDPILAYMYLMKRKAAERGTRFTREELMKTGSSLELFPGVDTWFKRVNRIGEEAGVRIEHYIISSGLTEIIEGSSIYPEFKKVYACSFYYDENSVPCWPKNVVNYTTKTQFLFRINKGVLDISEDAALNIYIPEEVRRVPFTNMLYIGDGLTDVPCMKLVKQKGGYSVAVYQQKEKVQGLVADNRVDFVFPADYSEGSEIELTVRDIIVKMAKESILRDRGNEQKAEMKK